MQVQMQVQVPATSRSLCGEDLGGCATRRALPEYPVQLELTGRKKSVRPPLGLVS